VMDVDKIEEKKSPIIIIINQSTRPVRQRHTVLSLLFWLFVFFRVLFFLLFFIFFQLLFERRGPK
jgi:hypothetical protein